ncbi:MAG: HAD-IA family hydrolase [Candidatus Babeliaceae bacterium]
MKLTNYFYILLMSAPLALFSKPTTLVFDLGYTLVKPNKQALSSEIGVIDYGGYSIFDGKDSDDMKSCVFDILSLIEGMQSCPECDIVRADDARPFPLALVNWQCGFIKPKIIHEEALEYVEELNDLGYFVSPREYRLVINALRIMLDPETLANSMKPIRKALKLVKECAEQTDENGEPLYELYILSNWDPTSFEIFTRSEKMQELLSYFKPENIVISGRINKIKPHKDIYQYLLSTYKIKPQECIFIDDQEENILGAQSCGITAIQLQDKNYKKLREELEELRGN